MRVAYLFERFPTFTQTFCVREVCAIRSRQPDLPVFSIRRPSGEPAQDYPADATRDIGYVPADIEEALRREAAPFPERLRRRWALWRQSKQSDRKRCYEALWLGPRLREAGIGHVHVHFAGMAARTAWWLHRLYGIRYSITAHANDFFVGANDRAQVTLSDLFRDVAQIVTVSEFSKRLLAERFPFAASRIHRVYNGIDPARFEGAAAPDAPPLVLAVGRYIEKKGFGTLVEAIAALPPDVAVTCQIIGEGPLENDLRRAAAELRGAARVEITGPLSEGEIIRRMARATAFVIPCIVDAKGDSDNLPTVIMEAMAAGLPVISTPVAGVPEMVVDGETGRIVPEHDARAVAEALQEFLRDPEAARRMGAAGRARCREMFAVDVTSRALEQVWNER